MYTWSHLPSCLKRPNALTLRTFRSPTGVAIDESGTQHPNLDMSYAHSLSSVPSAHSLASRRDPRLGRATSGHSALWFAIAGSPSLLGRSPSCRVSVRTGQWEGRGCRGLPGNVYVASDHCVQIFWAQDEQTCLSLFIGSFWGSSPRSPAFRSCRDLVSCHATVEESDDLGSRCYELEDWHQRGAGVTFGPGALSACPVVYLEEANLVSFGNWGEALSVPKGPPRGPRGAPKEPPRGPRGDNHPQGAPKGSPRGQAPRRPLTKGQPLFLPDRGPPKVPGFA